MATVRDVAKVAGVAPITVSRVVNNTGYISDKTRARVNEAIQQLGYVPNTLARSLRSRQTNILALVLTDITNPYWTTVARGVEDAASDAGFNLILCNTDESGTEEDKYVRLILEKHVDGILFVPARNSVEPVHVIQKQNVPVVVLDRRLPSLVADVVRSDSEGGAYQLVNLLLSLGHRRVSILSGPSGVSTADDRVAGYRRAMREAGIPESDMHVLLGQYTVVGGYDMAKRVLEETPHPTALFAANNFIAIGAFKALREAGLSVPEDIALVGFDDLPSFLMVDPFLTVAAQRPYEMGHKATELLLARLTHEAPQAYQEIILPVDILVRKSSGSGPA